MYNNIFALVKRKRFGMFSKYQIYTQYIDVILSILTSQAPYEGIGENI